MDEDEYGVPTWRAGELAPAGAYVRVDDGSSRLVQLKAPGLLPPTFDGHVALYCPAPAGFGTCADAQPAAALAPAQRRAGLRPAYRLARKAHRPAQMAGRPGGRQRHPEGGPGPRLAPGQGVDALAQRLVGGQGEVEAVGADARGEVVERGRGDGGAGRRGGGRVMGRLE